MTINDNAVNTKIQSNNTQKINQERSSISPLSSRYTYAIGSDGKKHII